MSGIKNYSTSAANNTTAPPNGAPEGMAPSSVNNTMRQFMADTRSFYEAADYIDLGHTPTYASTASFRLSGDLTSYYTANRPIQCNDVTAFYGLVLSSTYSSPNTTVTVKLDSASAALSTSLASISVGLLNPTKTGISAASAKFIQSGTGAIATDELTRNRQIVYVTDFKNDDGSQVVGDFNSSTGSGTDNTTGFTKAITYCLTNLKKLFVPAGDYKITSSLSVSANIYLPLIIGESRAGTVFWAVGFTGTDPVWDLTATNSSVTGIGTAGMYNFSIKRYGGGSNTGTAIRFNGIDGSVVQNFEIYDFTRGVEWFNASGGVLYSENNCLRDGYIQSCDYVFYFNIQSGGTALTSFNGSRIENVSVDLYDTQTLFNLTDYALIYNSMFDVKAWASSGSGTVYLYVANANSIFRDSVFNLFTEVSGSITATFTGGGATVSNVAGTYTSTGTRATSYPSGLFVTDVRTGTFTATATGFSGTAPTGTATYKKHGYHVDLEIPYITGTSNATTFTLTGMSTEIKPTAVRQLLVKTRDNGPSGPMSIAAGQIATDGTITFYADVDGTAFTGSGTKECGKLSVSYFL